MTRSHGQLATAEYVHCVGLKQLRFYHFIFSSDAKEWFGILYLAANCFSWTRMVEYVSQEIRIWWYLASHSQILRKTAHTVMAISVEEVELSSVRLLEALLSDKYVSALLLIPSVNMFCFLFSVHGYQMNSFRRYQTKSFPRYQTNLFWITNKSQASSCFVSHSPCKAIRRICFGVTN
jgi:hypothetical protein